MTGWNWLRNSTRWHWFAEDGRSLCKNYLIMGGNEDAKHGNDNSPDNCAECRRQLKKRPAPGAGPRRPFRK